MTAPALDTRDHVAALTAALAHPELPVFEYGEVPGLNGNPGSTPDQYVLLQVERRTVPNVRMVGLASRTGWRITVRPVAPDATRCRWALNHVSTRLEGCTLSVGGFDSIPLQHETTDSVTPDEGLFSAVARWTYSL